MLKRKLNLLVIVCAIIFYFGNAIHAQMSGKTVKEDKNLKKDRKECLHQALKTYQNEYKNCRTEGDIKVQKNCFDLAHKAHKQSKSACAPMYGYGKQKLSPKKKCEQSVITKIFGKCIREGTHTDNKCISANEKRSIKP